MAKPKAIKIPRPAAQYDVTAKGGPWDGLKFSTRIPPKGYTLVIKVGQIHGRYQMDGKGFAKWESVNA